MSAYPAPSQSAVAVSEADLEKLKATYTISADDVWSFLDEHPQLVEALLEAWSHLERLFGPQPHVRLEVHIDPETPGWVTLLADILTSLPVDQAHARLNRLDDEWYLNQPDDVRWAFIFDLEFV